MSETREQILEEIKIQGDLVRKLKAAKETKEKVSALRFPDNSYCCLFVTIYITLFFLLVSTRLLYITHI